MNEIKRIAVSSGARTRPRPPAAALESSPSLQAAPWTEPTATPTLVAVRHLDQPSDAMLGSFLKVRNVEVDIKRPGQKIATIVAQAVSSIGRHASIVAPLLLAPDGTPSLVFKAGDARPSRRLRDDQYVKPGLVAGWWDKPGASDMRIAHEELAEECNAQAVDGGMRSVGDHLLATMPNEALEGDRYFAAVVRLGAGAGHGDGTKNEAAGDLRPRVMSVGEGFEAIRRGTVGGNMRARVAFTRALDSVGYLPQLGRYVFDLPPALRSRFTTLGLGEANDPRGLAPAVHQDVPPQLKLASFQSEDADVRIRETLPLSAETWLVDVEAIHGGDGNYHNQLLHTTYDRAKIAVFYRDAEHGPMVFVEPGVRPAWLTANLDKTAALPSDLLETKTAVGDKAALRDVAAVMEERGVPIKGQPRQLGAPSDASPGLSDMRYRSFAVEVEPPGEAHGFVPLTDAIAACRQGQGGDAASEATLLALADALHYLPQLRMSAAQARALID